MSVKEKIITKIITNCKITLDVLYIIIFNRFVKYFFSNYDEVLNLKPKILNEVEEF